MWNGMTQGDSSGNLEMQDFLGKQSKVFEIFLEKFNISTNDFLKTLHNCHFSSRNLYIAFPFLMLKDSKSFDESP